MPHPLLVARSRRQARLPALFRPRALRRLRPGACRDDLHNAGPDAVPRAEHQQLQAVCRGLFRADRDRVGSRQPHLRVQDRRARRRAAHRVSGSGRRRQPVSRYCGSRGGGDPRHRRRAPPGTRVHRERVCIGQAARVPSTMREAATRFSESASVRAAFGDDVVEHYANFARVELSAYDAVVTDWERFRGFERL